jgi:hypothetical protein
MKYLGINKFFNFRKRIDDQKTFNETNKRNNKLLKKPTPMYQVDKNHN